MASRTASLAFAATSSFLVAAGLNNTTQARAGDLPSYAPPSHTKHDGSQPCTAEDTMRYMLPLQRTAELLVEKLSLAIAANHKLSLQDRNSQEAALGAAPIMPGNKFTGFAMINWVSGLYPDYAFRRSQIGSDGQVITSDAVTTIGEVRQELRDAWIQAAMNLDACMPTNQITHYEVTLPGTDRSVLAGSTDFYEFNRDAPAAQPGISFEIRRPHQKETEFSDWMRNRYGHEKEEPGLDGR